MDRFELFIFFSRFQFLSRKFTSPRWRGKHLLPTYWMIRYDLYNCLFTLENLRGWDIYIFQTNFYLTSFFPSPKNAEERSLVEWLTNYLTDLDCKILCHMKIPQELFILWIRVGVCRSTRPITNSVGFPDTEGEFPVEGEGHGKVCLSKSFYSIFRMNEWSGFYSVRIITSLFRLDSPGH